MQKGQGFCVSLVRATGWRTRPCLPRYRNGMRKAARITFRFPFSKADTDKSCFSESGETDPSGPLVSERHAQYSNRDEADTDSDNAEAVPPNWAALPQEGRPVEVLTEGTVINHAYSRCDASKAQKHGILPSLCLAKATMP
jgi:hypothetical protein